MILLFGPYSDPMVARVSECLQELDAGFVPVLSEDVPSTLRISLGSTQVLTDTQGNRLALDEVGAIYHRLGFAGFQIQEDYTPEESEMVYVECMAALQGYLNTTASYVINRPYASESNASKPEQARLLRKLGLHTPRTLVTNNPQAALAFYHEMDGLLIYKSVSYVRSIVQKFAPEDLDRLDSLSVCPIQLQEWIEGTDIRVHVVGDQVFASQILSEASDYRYDRQSEVIPIDLDEELKATCIAVARSLDLHLAGIDLRETPDGQVYCFEVNPSPAFTWYEDRTEQPIGRAIAERLMIEDGQVDG